MSYLVNSYIHSGIVTSGLVLNLDASNTISYPGTGTTWYDLSSNPSNATLTNGPTYTYPYIQFDATNDYATIASNSKFAFGTGDFTIEAWVWLDSTVNPIRPDNLKTVTIFSTGSASANDCSFAIYGSTSVAGVGLELYQASPSIALSVAATVTTNTWVHIAYVRSGTTIYGFVNGTRYTIGTTSAAIASSVSPKIGAANSSSYTNQFKGYIDDLRVTKGVARYTANFTPPTAPFPDT